MDELGGRERLTAAIAGAKGFVGRALCRELAPGHRVLALSRRSGEIPGVETRVCDLFALEQLEAALAGADVATVPAAVLKSLVKHPLTDKGLETFLADWKKTGQTIV